jgi:hypothetical protein
MGGVGSGRWRTHLIKVTVEACKRLPISPFSNAIRSLESGPYGWANEFQSWSRHGKPTGTVNLWLEGGEGEIAAWLSYQLTLKNHHVDYHYRIGLEYALLPWGARRWWWCCPECGRRAGALYLPPKASQFLCRGCHDLTYQSSQEHHKFDDLYRSLALQMQSGKPGLISEDIRYILGERKKPPLNGYFTSGIQSIHEKYLIDLLANIPDPYAEYLMPAELCARSGLSLVDLKALESIRLLLPDRDGKYRPKLVTWAHKLVYLITEGWSLNEINHWAKGRWATADPRQWPPTRNDWQV